LLHLGTFIFFQFKVLSEVTVVPNSSIFFSRLLSNSVCCFLQQILTVTHKNASSLKKEQISLFDYKMYQQQFSFPILPNQEIVGSLNDLGIHFQEEDLKEPQANTIRSVYEHIVELLAGISRETTQQPQFLALDKLPYPDLHDESIPEIAFLKYL
jgi:hypothetical protein